MVDEEDQEGKEGEQEGQQDGEQEGQQDSNPHFDEWAGGSGDEAQGRQNIVSSLRGLVLALMGHDTAPRRSCHQLSGVSRMAPASSWAG